MSLASIGVDGEILAYAKGEHSCFQDKHTVAKQPGLPFIENERKLVRDMVEAYLSSPQFVKDTHQLESTLTITIKRRVETSIYRT